MVTLLGTSPGRLRVTAHLEFLLRASMLPMKQQRILETFRDRISNRVVLDLGFRQGSQKQTTVGFGFHSRIKHHYNSSVRLATNQTAESLFELDNRFRQLVVAKRIATRFSNRL